MDTSPQPDLQRQPCRPVTGPQRLALWQAAQKQLHGKLDPHEVAKMREEWTRRLSRSVNRSCTPWIRTPLSTT